MGVEIQKDVRVDHNPEWKTKKVLDEGNCKTVLADPVKKLANVVGNQRFFINNFSGKEGPKRLESFLNDLSSKKSLSEKEVSVLVFRFLKGMSPTEMILANYFPNSRQWMDCIEEKALQKLREIAKFENVEEARGKGLFYRLGLPTKLINILGKSGYENSGIFDLLEIKYDEARQDELYRHRSVGKKSVNLLVKRISEAEEKLEKTLAYKKRIEITSKTLRDKILEAKGRELFHRLNLPARVESALVDCGYENIKVIDLIKIKYDKNKQDKLLVHRNFGEKSLSILLSKIDKIEVILRK